MPQTKPLIYFDNASTTIVDEQVLKTFNQIVTEYIANPSSTHFEGQKSFHLLEKSRQQILDVLNLKGYEVIYTSGATEANNLAIKGYCLANKNRGNHIITSLVEHPSVLNAIKQLESFGFEVTYLPVNVFGVVEVKDVIDSIKENTILVSLMMVNNEVGAINPIKQVGEYLLKYPKIVFHVDVTQAVGKFAIPFEVIDMFAFSGHKIHALDGSGALVKKSNILLLPLASGGGQENNLRSGTNTLALSSCLCKAIRLSYLKMNENFNKVTPLYNKLVEYLKENDDLFKLNSSNSNNPYIVNFSLKKHKASVLVEALSNANIMVSSISACHSRKEKMSEVVYQMYHDDSLAFNTVRVSFSYSNTIEEVDILIEQLKQIVKEIRQ